MSDDPNIDWEVVDPHAKARFKRFLYGWALALGITVALCVWHGPTDLRLRTWGTVLQLVGICLVVFDIKDRLRLYRMRFSPRPTKEELEGINAKPEPERNAFYWKSFVQEYGNTMSKFQVFLGTGWERSLFGVYCLILGVVVATFAPEIVKIESGQWREVFNAF